MRKYLYEITYPNSYLVKGKDVGEVFFVAAASIIGALSQIPSRLRDSKPRSIKRLTEDIDTYVSTRRLIT